MQKLNSRMILFLSIYLILLTITFFTNQIPKYEGFLFKGLIAINILSVFSFLFGKVEFKKVYYFPFKKIWLPFVLFFFHFLFLPISLSMDLINFTYGDYGLDPVFMAWLPVYALLFYLGVVFGVEGFFRLGSYSFLSLIIKSKLLWSAVQAILSSVWIILCLYPALQYAEAFPLYFFILTIFFIQWISGVLFLISRSIWISGLWTGMVLFVYLFVMSNIVLNLSSAHYYVTSSVYFYGVGLFFELVLVFFILILYSTVTRKN